MKALQSRLRSFNTSARLPSV
jgi:propionyl-CoA carboxylase beta chain